MDYDYMTNTLFANACSFTGNNVDYLLKVSNLTGSYSGTFIPVNTGTSVYFSAVKYSPYSPTNKTTLFIGTQAGQLFKIQNAESTPTKTEITGSSFPTANISSIAIGGSEDTLLVTFSNYGVISVWQTYNGGQSWQNKESNLPDMPIRWAIYHPDNYRQAMLATETGAWATANLDETNPLWEPVNDGMANVRVDMLDLRKSDRTVLAGTHGRGFFTTTWDVVTGVKGIQQSAISVFPNPTSGIFNIKGANGCKVEVYTREGKINRTEMISSNSAKVDLTGMPTGIYLLKIHGNGNKYRIEKIVKE
jgi:hypothetical protein